MSKTIEDKYKKLDEIEHCLLRPGMYIGSTIPQEIKTAVLDDGKMLNKDLSYTPGMLKLLDEIISNSIDEHLRTKHNKRKEDRLDAIQIRLYEDGKFSAYDDGGIPVEFHTEENLYVQELIFGSLRAGSNFDDEESREVIGTNGVGSSLANIFSKEFRVQTADGHNCGDVTWRNNMSDKSDIKIKKSAKRFTHIELQLDLERFEEHTISHSMMKLVEKRCIIAAASNPGLSVSFNGEKHQFKSFREYVELYSDTYPELVGEKNSQWEFYIAPTSVQNGGNFHAIVNGAECNSGTHIKMLDSWVINDIKKALQKQKLDLTNHQIRKHFSGFINITVDKPAYDSQSKTNLTTDLHWLDADNKKRWLQMSAKVHKQIAESSLVSKLSEFYNTKESEAERAELNKAQKELKKSSAKHIKKLIDCTAKTKKDRKDAELWIFEGNSASSGFRTARKPKTQASYCLKGKCKNSFGMSTLNVVKNQEFADIIVGSGLNPAKPDDVSKLRFGKFVIATDADVDGHSIAGQLITLFGVHFPDIIEMGMLYRAVTPIAKATKSKTAHYFYTMDDYRQFTDSHRGWKTSYFKGLGSLEKHDFREMLQNPRFEQYSLSPDDMEVISDWMGNDSNKRKKYFEAIRA